MKNNKIRFLLLLLLIISSFQTIAQTTTEDQKIKTIAAQGKDYDFSAKQKARNFSSNEVAFLSSAADLKLIDGQLITSNDLAFDQKIKLIQNAKKEIRMVYFIYASDDSTSKINQALIDSAKNKGVKIKILVDFVTNYKNLDLFSMLEKEGAGNIHTYFYNVPNQQMVQDVNYIVLPCPKLIRPDSDSCFNFKVQTLNNLSDKKAPSSFAKIFLAGLYGRNATALKIALGYGAEIDPQQSKMTIQENLEEIIEYSKLMAEAIFNDNFIAKIKLSIAMSLHGEKLNPLINEISGRFPFKKIDPKDTDHGKLWEHLTDYTHHKLLAIDGNQFQMGGRNLEDSYHMNQRVSKTGKYIFIDTDFWGKTKDGGTLKIEASFDKLLSSSMVANLALVKNLMSYDFIMNTGSKIVPGAGALATGFCLQQKTKESAKEDLGSCILKTMPMMPGYRSEEFRINEKLEAMNIGANNYDTKYVNDGLKNTQNLFGHLSQNDLKTAQYFYLENVNYQAHSMKRILGSKIGSEAKNQKNIQAAWYRSLENACKVSRDERREVRVIFHSAYLLMPSGMLHQISKMMNNDYGDCSKVRLTFITNSTLTTDLAPINVLASYQLSALFTHYGQLVNYKNQFEKDGFFYKRFFPTLEYFEIKASAGVGSSLHTKVSLIGNDLIVGSANADIRSYFMDTNNALMIRNAKELNQEYLKYIDQLISSSKLENKTNHFMGKTILGLRQENEYMLNALAKYYHQEKLLTKERMTMILDNLDRAGKKIFETTNRLLLYRGDFDLNQLNFDSNSIAYKYNQELNELANSYDKMFMIF